MYKLLIKLTAGVWCILCFAATRCRTAQVFRSATETRTLWLCPTERTNEQSFNVGTGSTEPVRITRFQKRVSRTRFTSVVTSLLMAFSTLVLKPSFSQRLYLHSHRMLRLVSGNLTTRCLAVTGGGSISPNWLVPVQLAFGRTKV